MPHIHHLPTRTLLMLTSLCVGGIISVGGCGSSSTSTFGDPDSGASSSSGASGSGGFGEGGTRGCSEEAKLVYVVSEENALYSFKPDTLTFTKIGTLRCPVTTTGSTPNSMAIDRSGTAWVNYTDGSLFKVSTRDAGCEATSFARGQSGFGRFGMAFSTNSANTEEETLYVCGIEGTRNGRGLAKIDLGTMVLSPIGDFSGQLKGLGAELTGTGDARLYGFFTTLPDATLAQIDRASAATTGDVSLTGVSTGNAWAFSFWGGDFWFYTAAANTPSVVTRLEPANGNKITVAKADVGGFRIVGAGVSTCAPLGPVR